MKIPTLLIAYLPTGETLFNQGLVRADAVLTPQFFIAVFAGVVLALTFQLILTALSLVLGISMIGNVKENYVHSRVHPSESDGDHDESSSSTGVKISTAFGVWSTLTTCIAVFGGTALAMQLDIFNSIPSRITLALVIWGLFFLILFYLESRFLSTVVGGLFHTATAGIKSSLGAVKNMFGPSDSTKIEHTIESAISKIRKEFDEDFDTSKISGVLDNFLKKVDKKIPEYDKLKKDLKDIMDQSGDSNGSGNAMAIQQVLTKAIDENLDSDDDNSKSKVVKLKELLEESKKAYDEGDDKEDGIKKAAAKLTDQDEGEIDKKISAVKEFISKATPDSFTDEDLNNDLEKIINDPKSSFSVVSSHFKDFDKDSLIELLSKNTSLKKEQLEGYADKVTGTIDKLTKGSDGDSEKGFSKRAEESVAGYLNSTGKEELNYEDLKSDISRLIDNPKDGLDIIKSRLAKFDSETLRALVTNNKYVDESQIDDIINSIEQGKQTIAQKVDQIQAKATAEYKMIERKAVIQAEHARKTAATAAWWLVASIVISARAAILGGVV